MKDVIKGAVGIAMAVAGAVIAVDRMATSLVRSNQRLINFQRTTGISLGTLQKYAQANVAVNPLASNITNELEGIIILLIMLR